MFVRGRSGEGSHWTKVSCAAGFNETRDDDCSDVITPQFAAAHGGNCTGHEKKHL